MTNNESTKCRMRRGRRHPTNPFPGPHTHLPQLWPDELEGAAVARIYAGDGARFVSERRGLSRGRGRRPEFGDVFDVAFAVAFEVVFFFFFVDVCFEFVLICFVVFCLFVFLSFFFIFF